MDETIAEKLIDASVLKTGTFQMATGQDSPVYVDLRILPSYPESFGIISDAFAQLVKDLGVEVVAGAESAGIPMATAVAIKANLPMVYIRRRPKGYGPDAMIEGVLKKGSKVALIDDIITNGGSKLRFIDGIRRAGGNVQDIAVILDREQGGAEFLDKEGIRLHKLITLKELLGHMRQKSLIEKSEYLSIMEYLNQNVSYPAP